MMLCMRMACRPQRTDGKNNFRQGTQTPRGQFLPPGMLYCRNFERLVVLGGGNHLAGARQLYIFGEGTWARKKISSAGRLLR